MAPLKVSLEQHMQRSTLLTLVQEFEKALKEVVGAKRVSASKMTSLTESALKSMDVRFHSSIVLNSVPIADDFLKYLPLE